MQDSKRKYMSEFALCLPSGRWLITPASELMSGGTMKPEEQEVADNCHIYLICKRPVISFAKDSFGYENGAVFGHLNYRVEGQLRELEFSLPFQLYDGATEVRLSNYPHREIKTFDSDGKEVRHLPAFAVGMFTGIMQQNQELRDLEVLYVGQAFGDGKRSAYDRLMSHSTLQRILAEVQNESPDSEIQLLTFEYDQSTLITQMDGRAKHAISDYRDMDRFRNILTTPLSEREQICLAEAGLIRYFQPRYNAIYKNNFPDDTHKILESCYDLDFSGLVVEIDTEEIGRAHV